MTVGNREFSGKKAREEAGTALVNAIMSWKDDKSLKVRGHYKGFEILSSGSQYEDYAPNLYVRGRHTYEASLNPDNALGTIASIEYALRRIDRDAEEVKAAIERKEKALADYRGQLNRPFEHEERLRDLLVKQQEINNQLDLDKSDTQVVADDVQQDYKATDSFVDRLAAEGTYHDKTNLDRASKDVMKLREAINGGLPTLTPSVAPRTRKQRAPVVVE